MSSKKKDKKEKEKKEKDKTKIKLKHKPSKSKLLIGASKSSKPDRAVSESGPTVSFSAVMPPRARSTSIGVQRLRKSTDPDSTAEPPTPDTSSMSNSEGKSPDVLRKAVAELAELENLIDDEIESDPAENRTSNQNNPHAAEDDEFIFDTTLDFEKKVDFLSQLADDFAMNLPEDVERAFEEVISALQAKDSETILGLTADNFDDDIGGVDYDNYIDSIIQHTQQIDLGDDDDFTFDMKIEGLDEYRQSLGAGQPNELEKALMDVDKQQPTVPSVVVHSSPIIKPLPDLPDSPTDTIDIGQVSDTNSPYKSPRVDNVDPSVSSPRVLTPKKVTPTESMDKGPSSPSRVITPRQVSSPRHSVEDIPPIEVTAPKTPRQLDFTDQVDNGATKTPREVEHEDPTDTTPRDPMPRRGSDESSSTPQPTPRDAMPSPDSTERSTTPKHTPRIITPRQDELNGVTTPTPQNTPREVDEVSTPKTTPREHVEVTEPVDSAPVRAGTTPREVSPDAADTTPEHPIETPQEVETPHTEHASEAEDSSSSDSDSSDSSDSESSEEETQPQSPKADETRTASGNIKVPLIPVQNAVTNDGDNEPLTTTRGSGKTSRRGSDFTAAEKQKIIAARREATLKMAQQLRDELKAGTGDPVTKRQRLAQLLNEFKGVQVKGLINIFEQKMKEVVKK